MIDLGQYDAIKKSDPSADEEVFDRFYRRFRKTLEAIRLEGLDGEETNKKLNDDGLSQGEEA